jgi:menaquinone-dependent protoporphyrinogen oxidase
MREAAEFLDARKDILKKTPLWLFSSGPIGEGDPHQLVDGVVLPEAIVKLTHNLNVQEKQIFHGKVDLRKLSLAELMLFKSVGARTGDYRHWDMIKLWAQSIRDQLVRAKAKEIR